MRFDQKLFVPIFTTICVEAFVGAHTALAHTTSSSNAAKKSAVISLRPTQHQLREHNAHIAPIRGTAVDRLMGGKVRGGDMPNVDLPGRPSDQIDTKAGVSEVLGTAGLTAVITMMGSSLLGLDPISKSFGVGATILVVTLAGFPFSGAHFNPMVTLCLALQKKIGPQKSLFYVASQMLGGLLGAAFAQLMISPGSLPDPAFALSKPTGFVEVFFTFALLQTIVQSTSNAWNMQSFAFAPTVALLVGLSCIFGANMNPALSTGLSIMTKSYGGIGQLWLLPSIAALLASFVPYLTNLASSNRAWSPVSKSGDAVSSYLPQLTSVGGKGKALGVYVNEFLGTFLLTTVLLLSLITGKLSIPIAGGLMLLVQLFSSRHVSGTHLNPAVSVGVFLRAKGLGGLRYALQHALFQILGAGSATFLLQYCFGNLPKVLPNIPSGISLPQAAGAEAIFSALLVQTILSFSLIGKNIYINNLTVAAVYMAGLFASSAISGGLLNPALALPLLVLGKDWQQPAALLTYLAGPLIGGAIAGWFKAPWERATVLDRVKETAEEPLRKELKKFSR